MKSSLLILSCLLAYTYSQGRPSYAGTLQKGIPDLGSRFKVDSTSTNNIADRLDVDGNAFTSTTGLPPQVNLGQRVDTWPRENQPFWHINADVINKHISRPQNGNTNQIGDQRQFQINNSNQLRGSFTNPSSSSESSSNESSRQRISSRSSSYDYDNVRQLKSSRRNSN